MAGTRNTIQRDLVLQAVLDLQNHPTPEEVYMHIRKKHPTISKGTVYRNLNVLVEKGLLSKVDVPDSANRVDHILSPHYHIECRVCGGVYDMDMPDMSEEIKKHIRNTNGFEIEKHDLIFSGVCPKCKEKRTKLKGELI